MTRSFDNTPAGRAIVGFPPAPAEQVESARLEKQLMRLVKSHDDPDAFVRLVDLVGPSIKAVLRRGLPWSQREEALQEVSCRGWLGRKRYSRRKGSPRTWFCAIARNLVRDTFRRACRRPVAVSTDGSLGQMLPLPDPRTADPAVAVERADWADHVRRLCEVVLAAAPPYVRASWHLRLQGRHLVEVARAVGKPLGTVAGALYRVQAQVRALVHDNHHPIP